MNTLEYCATWENTCYFGAMYVDIIITYEIIMKAVCDQWLTMPAKHTTYKKYEDDLL